MFRIEISRFRIAIGTIVAIGLAYISTISNTNLLSGMMFYFLVLVFLTLVVFGVGKDRLLPSSAFVLFYIAFGGLGFQYYKVMSLLFGTFGIVIVSIIVQKYNQRDCLWVKVKYNDQDFSMKALLDTGNMLSDPVSGRPVLVVGADIAQKMTGLSLKQIQNPIDSIGAIPGLRLIPYRTVGQSGLFLLGLPVKKMQIGKWQGSGIIALSPEILCSNGSFQALTGGRV